MIKFKNLNTNDYVRISLLIALIIFFARFLRIPTDAVRISFSFLPLAVCGMLYGPEVSAIAAILADIMGFIIGGESAAFNLGITLVSGLNGFVYGFILYNKSKNYLRIVVVSFLIFLISVFLNTYFIALLQSAPYMTKLVERVYPMFIMFLIRIPIIGAAYGYIVNRIQYKSY